MQVVKREEKQIKLTTFITEQIDHLASDDRLSCDHELLLVALSATSPVIGALKEVAAARDLSQIQLRIILANIQGADLFRDLSGLPPVSVNWARNARLLDAHEQLVVGKTACWTGDCMRREPNKRDAFECFADDCQETSAWARTSFDRLWAASVPLISPQDWGRTETAGEVLIPAQPAEPDVETITGTRH